LSPSGKPVLVYVAPVFKRALKIQADARLKAGATKPFGIYVATRAVLARGLSRCDDRNSMECVAKSSRELDGVLLETGRGIIQK
jgi:hypothetical protein